MSRDITVYIALVVVNGVQSIVKTVVQTVESAALMVGAFFQRVGLQIKQVISFTFLPLCLIGTRSCNFRVRSRMHLTIAWLRLAPLCRSSERLCLDTSERSNR